jgi:hypothetical protein
VAPPGGAGHVGKGLLESPSAVLRTLITIRTVLEGHSTSGHHAKDGDGQRYQIESRRITRHSKSRQPLLQKRSSMRDPISIAAQRWSETDS